MLFKNETQNDFYLLGQPLLAGQFFIIPENLKVKFASDNQTLVKLLNTDLTIWINENLKIENILMAVEALAGNFVDGEGNLSVKQKTFANPENLAFRGKAIQGNLASGEIKYFDLKIETPTYMDGGEIFAHAEAFHGDRVSAQIVDVDGILSPAGTILSQYVSNWGIGKDGKMSVKTPYAGRIVPGLYIRVIYTAGSGHAVSFSANLFLHEET